MFRNGDERRKKILEILMTSEEPVSGGTLAKQLGVSRQIVVQDIALIRAVNRDVLATNKGYMIHSSKLDQGSRRVICVKHDKTQIADELNTIVDFGGHVLNVVVEHDIYGQIIVDLLINNRQDVVEFVDKINSKKSQPLKELTNGIHFHTIIAPSEEVIDAIEMALDKRGYLYNM